MTNAVTSASAIDLHGISRATFDLSSAPRAPVRPGIQSICAARPGLEHSPDSRKLPCMTAPRTNQKTDTERRLCRLPTSVSPGRLISDWKRGFGIRPDLPRTSQLVASFLVRLAISCRTGREPPIPSRVYGGQSRRLLTLSEAPKPRLVMAVAGHSRRAAPEEVSTSIAFLSRSAPPKGAFPGIDAQVRRAGFRAICGTDGCCCDGSATTQSLRRSSSSSFDGRLIP